jgi:hypothetical protein
MPQALALAEEIYGRRGQIRREHDLGERPAVRVSADLPFGVDTNDYSVNPSLVGQCVQVCGPQRAIAAAVMNTGVPACWHVRSFAKHRTITVLEHVRARWRRQDPDPDRRPGWRCDGDAAPYSQTS